MMTILRRVWTAVARSTTQRGAPVSGLDPLSSARACAASSTRANPANSARRHPTYSPLANPASSPRARAARARAFIVLALTVLTGNIVDRTTGQPLTGVDVRAEGGSTVAPARTNDAGHYALRGLTPGHYTLTVSSDDVPPQRFEVTVRGGKTQKLDITACSTTLDYSCAAASP